MKKILLADDQPEVRLLVQTTLEGTDYEFCGAGDGKEALEKAVSLKPDLIILDIMMPQIDGYEVCARIRANPETRDIPVIMLTAKGQKQDIEKGLACGVADYIVKPFSPLALLKKVDEVLRK